MSSPPIRLPWEYNCGYVGQSENFLRPCLTCYDNQEEFANATSSNTKIKMQSNQNVDFERISILPL